MFEAILSVLSFARVLCKVKNQTGNKIDFYFPQNFPLCLLSVHPMHKEFIEKIPETSAKKIILKCKSLGLKQHVTPSSFCLLSFFFGSSIIYFVARLLPLWLDARRFLREWESNIASIPSMFKLLMRNIFEGFD